MAALSSIAAAAILGGAAINALGSVAQGNAAKAQADFQSAVEKNRAAQTKQVATVNEQDFRRDQSRALASRRAAMGASGINIDTGSPLLTSVDFAREIELQAQRIRYGGDVAKTRLEEQASLIRAGGQSDQDAGYLRAGSSLLTGFGRMYG